MLVQSKRMQDDTEANSLTAYFGISKSNRDQLCKEVNSIKKVLKKNHINLEVFVDKYDFAGNEEKEMMRIAFSEIDKCDFLIAELTKKAIGVGVEVGYAKAKGKPIIYMRKVSSEYSTTVGGSSDYLIEYNEETELKIKLEMAIEKVKGAIKLNSRQYI